MIDVDDPESERGKLTLVLSELEPGPLPGPDTWRDVADELPDSTLVRAWFDDGEGDCYEETSHFHDGHFHDGHFYGDPHDIPHAPEDDDITRWRPLATGPDA